MPKMMKFYTWNSRILKAGMILMFSLSIGFVHAQSAYDWKLQSEKDGVKLYSTTAACGGRNMLLLKLENGNAEAKRINYNIIIESPGHNMPLRPQSLDLKASESKMGSCDTSRELTTDMKDIVNYQLKVVMTVN